MILKINGKQREYTTEEVIAKLEELERLKADKLKPKEGKIFFVTPKRIDQNLFLEKRLDESQEETRKIIIEAFKYSEKNPEYLKDFQTYVPNKKWDTINPSEIRELAKFYKGNIAIWVEQAWEWAQRIYNGETWENLCNKPDYLPWYRLVIWTNGYYKFIGGANQILASYGSTHIKKDVFSAYKDIQNAVPLIVKRN